MLDDFDSCEQEAAELLIKKLRHLYDKDKLKKHLTFEQFLYKILEHFETYEKES